MHIAQGPLAFMFCRSIRGDANNAKSRCTVQYIYSPPLTDVSRHIQWTIEVEATETRSNIG